MFASIFDPETEAPHIHKHGVDEKEVVDVLLSPGEDRPGREGSRVVIGKIRAGRYLRVIYVSRSGTGPRICDHRVRITWKAIVRVSKTLT
jgi:uncharacterized DUF497 family protein